jgi:two-component system chemotaxis response regulator CheY
MNVLVVDDSAVMRKIIVKALSDNGYTDIVEASNGQEALGKMQDIDIVFTDWNMPVMDGITFVKELRKSSKVPIVMITTEGGQKEVIEAMRSGVNDYIVKPFTPSVLNSKMESLVKK